MGVGISPPIPADIKPIASSRSRRNVGILRVVMKLREMMSLSARNLPAVKSLDPGISSIDRL